MDRFGWNPSGKGEMGRWLGKRLEDNGIKST